MKQIAVILIVFTIMAGNKPLPANDHIAKNFILTTTPDWVADDNATSNGLINSCETANYIWGHGRGVVWKKSKTSGDWTSIYDAGIASATFSDSNRALVVFYISDSTRTGKYSTDEGQTWNSISQLPNFDVSYRPYYPIDGWHFASHNGIFILGEYLADGTKPPQIFKSTDNGATWSTVYTETKIDGINNSHVHCVGYHAGLDAFVAILGDGPNKTFLKSDSTGNNWIRLMIGRGSQPVQLVDYGHPTRILCGSDTQEVLCSTDLVAETAYNVLNDRLTVVEKGQDGEIWAARKSDGIYYAFSYYEGSAKVSFGGVRWPQCFVSSDGENWATYHQIPSSTALAGVQYISGTAQGYLHVTVNNGDGTYSYWKLKKPTLSYPRTGILIQANAANLLDTPDKSFFATSNATQFWDETGINATLTSESSGGLFGPRCLKTSKETGLPGFIFTSPHNSPPAIQYERNGRRVYGRAWVRGITNNENLAFSFSNSRGQSLSNNILHTWTRWHLNDSDRWTEIFTATPGDTALDTGANDGYLLFRIGDSGSNIIEANNTATLYLGGAVAAYAPINFIDAEPVRPDISFDYLTTAGTSWTTYLTIIPDVPFQTVRYYWIPWISGYSFDTNDYCTHHAGQAGEARLYRSAVNNNSSEPPANWIDDTNNISKQPHWHIKTWDDAHGNKLVLYLDCMPAYSSDLNEIQGRKLKLDIYINGALRQTLESTPFAWDRHSQWQIAVSAGSNIKLFVQHAERTLPELIESSDASVATALANGAFKNCVISHHYGDTFNMQSFTFYTIPDVSKEKTSVPDNAAVCRAEMDIIDGPDNPITQQPQNVTVCKGANATFSVGGASGCDPIHYQWKKNDSNVGDDNSILTFYDVQPSDNGSKITCKVSNSCGSAITNPVLLTVTPLITQQPQNVTMCTSGTAKFSVGAAPGCGTIHYQWKKNGSIAGTDNSTLSLYSVQLNDNGSEITCEVSNSCDSAITTPVILTVVPIITLQPQNVAVKENSAATFSISGAPGCGNLHYQWKKNGLIAGSDAPQLTLYNVKLSDNGSVITCDVNNLCESGTSNPAILNIVHTVKASAALDGSIDPNGDVNVIHGTNQSFTATNTSNQIAQWFVDGNPADRGIAVYTLTNIQSDHSVYVTFSAPLNLSEGMILCINDWLQTDSAADIAPAPNGDGIVNFIDFAAFAQQ